MQISYSTLAMATKGAMNRDFRTLNTATNRLLSELDVYRGPSNPAGASLSNLAASEGRAIRDGLAVANGLITACQAADSALATIHGKLSSMREIVDDVALGEYTQEELEAKDELFQAVVAEVEDILAEAEHDGTALLTGYGALVRVNLDSVTSMAMTDLPEGATATMTLAMSDITAARASVASTTTGLGETIDELNSQAEKVTSFEVRVFSSERALEVVRDLTVQFVSSIATARTAQPAPSPWSATALMW